MAVADLTNWDDDRFITFNRLFDVGGWTYVSAAFDQIQFEAYQPLHLLSYLPDRYLWPHWSPGFHLFNLALFAIDLLVLWRLVRRHTSELAAFAAVAVFALHPVCVEPVAWVTSRKDLVMLLFFLLSLGCEDGRRGARPSPAALVLYLCALLTKSSSVCFPVVLAAWLYWVRGQPLRHALLRSASYAVAALAVSVFVFTVWRDHEMILTAGAGERAVDVAASAVTFATHVVWPVDLAPVYPTATPCPVADVVALAIAALALAVCWRRLPARARFAVVAIAAVLLPVSNVIPMSLRVADRYLFVALALLALPFASGLDLAMARARTYARPIAVCGALALALVVGLEARASAQLAPSWQTSRTLWQHATMAQPQAFLAHVKYAETLEDAQQWSAATQELRIAHDLRPNSLVPLEQLFQLTARRAQAGGQLAAGTWVGWVNQLDRAIADRPAFDALAAEVDASPCATCSHALLLVGLSAWPRSDAELIASAQQALDAHAWERARIYLAQVRDRTLAPLAELTRRVDAERMAASRPAPRSP